MFWYENWCSPELLLTLHLIYTYFCPMGQYDMAVTATSPFSCTFWVKGLRCSLVVTASSMAKTAKKVNRFSKHQPHLCIPLARAEMVEPGYRAFCHLPLHKEGTWWVLRWSRSWLQGLLAIFPSITKEPDGSWGFPGGTMCYAFNFGVVSQCDLKSVHSQVCGILF